MLTELSISKPFVITGNSLVTKTNVIEQVKSAAGCQVVAVCSAIKQFAPIEDVQAAVSELKKSGGDGVIAVGGGSPIDAAKVVISFYKEEVGKWLKLVCIPTTLSAAEQTITAGYIGKLCSILPFFHHWSPMGASEMFSEHSSNLSFQLQDLRETVRWLLFEKSSNKRGCSYPNFRRNWEKNIQEEQWFWFIRSDTRCQFVAKHRESFMAFK